MEDLYSLNNRRFWTWAGYFPSEERHVDRLPPQVSSCSYLQGPLCHRYTSWQDLFRRFSTYGLACWKWIHHTKNCLQAAKFFDWANSTFRKETANFGRHGDLSKELILSSMQYHAVLNLGWIWDAPAVTGSTRRNVKLQVRCYFWWTL